MDARQGSGEKKMRTEVAIVGGGPSGLLLSQLLNRSGIATVILERSSRAHVLGRIRAGVLEGGTVEVLTEAGVGARGAPGGIAHAGGTRPAGARQLRIAFADLAARPVRVYGQPGVTADLYAAQDAMGTTILHGVEDVAIDPFAPGGAQVAFTHDGRRQTLDCAHVAGCDGFHGVSRRTLPDDRRQEFERVYPFGWLGILSRTRPVHHELIYANSPRGFALASMRNPTLSRYYVQVPLTDRVEDWPDDRFWDELRLRLPAGAVAGLETGPSIEKSIAPLRSFVSEPMRWGNLFLVGDAAHIVPPTGAKGLNLAVSDVAYLHEALVAALRGSDAAGLERYSDRALARIWKAMRFSWQMTTMLHRFDGEDAFAPRMRQATLAHLAASETARRDLAENYVGLPL